MNEIIIDIEGIDGVGKGTQSKILYDRLLAEGYSAKFLTFPNYDSFFGKMVGNYLNGNYGNLSSVPVEFSTLLYALDRWQQFSTDICERKESNTIYVIDRYVLSNLAHQVSKLPYEKREHFTRWIVQLEYNIFKIPKPSIVLILDGDPNITCKYILKKETRSYTKDKMDIHEQDKNYLNEVRNTFSDLSKTNDSFHLINCTNGKKLRPINEISCEIWEIVLKYFDSINLKL